MKFNYKTIITTTAFIALVTPLIAGAAIKSSHYDHSEVVISYHSTELNSFKGRAGIETQIRQAARKICGPATLISAGSLKNAMANKSCYTAAVDKAMDDINGMSITAR